MDGTTVAGCGYMVGAGGIRGGGIGGSGKVLNDV
jgi:hypothetical protein